MKWFIAASVLALVVPIGGIGAWADEPPAAGKEPVVVATWEHRFTRKDGTTNMLKIKLYSNGKINEPDSKDTWVQKDNTLTLRWPNPKAPGGAWQDTCKISADGKTYSGRSQDGKPCTGKLVRKADAPAAKAATPAAPTVPQPAATNGAAPSFKGQSLLGETVKGEVRKVGDATVTTLKLDGRSLSSLFWDSDKGDAFIALEYDVEKGSVIRRISCPDFKVLHEKPVYPASWLCRSAEGLVLTAAGGLWLLDAETFDVKLKIAPSVVKVVSAPSLSIAVGSAADARNILQIFDLKTGKRTLLNAIEYYDRRTGDMGPGVHPFQLPILTPDGKYLFTRGAPSGSQICRFRLDAGKFIFEEISQAIGSGVKIEVSPDSQRVCMLVGGRRETPVFSMSSLDKPVCTLPLVFGAHAVGFDPVSRWIYAVTGDPSLVVFAPEGVKKKEYPLGQRSFGVRQCLVHPDGGKLLVVMNPNPYFIELPKKE